MLNLSPHSIFPSPHDRVERQKGLNLLSGQLSLHDLFVPGRGIGRVPGLLANPERAVDRFDARPIRASLRNRGRATTGYPHRETVIGLSLIHKSRPTESVLAVAHGPLFDQASHSQLAWS